MIFLRYENFNTYIRRYPATSVIIVLNVLYFIYTALTGSTTDSNHLYSNGALIAHPVLDPYGMLEPWRYFTSMFMHAGLQHILFNMFALIVFAPPLEHLLRSVRYSLFYIICGLGGGLLSTVMHSLMAKNNEWLLAVGASGAIYGVYGAYLFIALFRKSMLDPSSVKTVYMILGFGVVYSVIVEGVSFWGHMGGAVTGFLLYFLFDSLKMSRIRRQ